MRASLSSTPIARLTMLRRLLILAATFVSVERDVLTDMVSNACGSV